MAIIYPGRCESLIRIPTGGAAVSASTGALTSAVTVTADAGDYYMTAAGSVSSLLEELQFELNAAILGYPQSASAVREAIKYGVWSGGWLCDDASGNIAPAFGGVTLTATSSPTYGTAGPLGGADKAVGFDSAADCFDGGDVYDVTATDDLCVAWVGKFTGTPGTEMLIHKDPAATPSWNIYADGVGGIRLGCNTATSAVEASTSLTSTIGLWHVGIAVIDRSTGKGRVGLRTLDGTVSSVSSEVNVAAQTMANATGFRIGARGVTLAPTNWLCAAAYIGAGSGVATGLSTNLSTALTNFANAINSEFSVSMSTSTGRVSITNSHYPSLIAFTSTALRDVIGFEYDFDYPASAAALAAALQYGTWTSGAAWQCNESSGDLSPAFGSVTLADSGTPTYSNYGPRGGNDKAVGFNSTTDAFSGGDTFDAGATDDLIVLWVANVASKGGSDEYILSKRSGTTGWIVYLASATSLRFNVGDGVDNPEIAATISSGWHVGIAVIERATNKMRLGTCPLSGSPTVTSETDASAVGSLENAGSFLLGHTANAPTGTTVSYVAVVTGSGVATGLSANLSTALSNFATYMKSQTSTEQAEAVWFPDCPLSLEGDPSQAPPVTDARASQGPTGNVLRLAGNKKYRHRGITWTHVPRNRVWESEAEYANASWEHFVMGSLGFSHSWLGHSPLLQIYWNEAGVERSLGYTFNSSAGVNGWAPLNLEGVEPVPSQAGWTGLFRIELGDVVSSGT